MLCLSRKVYGIAGLTAAKDDPEFTVNYSHSVSEVYRDVVRYVVTVTHNLGINSTGNGSARLDWLPSWAPDWSQHTENGNVLIRSGGFDAAQGRPANATFESSGKILRVEGISVSAIQSVVLPINERQQTSWFGEYESYSFYHLLLAICSWHETAKEGHLW